MGSCRWSLCWGIWSRIKIRRVLMADRDFAAFCDYLQVNEDRDGDIMWVVKHAFVAQLPPNWYFVFANEILFQFFTAKRYLVKPLILQAGGVCLFKSPIPDWCFLCLSSGLSTMNNYKTPKSGHFWAGIQIANPLLLKSSPPACAFQCVLPSGVFFSLFCSNYSRKWNAADKGFSFFSFCLRTEHVDDEGRVYFFNQITNKSSWSHPLDKKFKDAVTNIKEWRHLEPEKKQKKVLAHIESIQKECVESLKGMVRPLWG